MMQKLGEHTADSKLQKGTLLAIFQGGVFPFPTEPTFSSKKN
jgi:hypothetical protein